MMDSRVESARIVGEAIAASARPPRVWLQMSTATVYAHRFDAANDEATGLIGGSEPDVPDYWAFSIDIATAFGRDTATACEAPSSSTIVAPARLAPKRSTSGLIASSAAATSAHDGFVFQAAAEAVSSNAAAASGHWATARILVTAAGTSAASTDGKVSSAMASPTG
jgi:hypothetical protein